MGYGILSSKQHQVMLAETENIKGWVNDMIVAERKPKTLMDKFDKFGEEMPDGRLTAPSDGKVYRLREAILLSKQLGRPLTQEEESGRFTAPGFLPVCGWRVHGTYLHPEYPR